jgi:hypothetical protein
MPENKLCHRVYTCFCQGEQIVGQGLWIFVLKEDIFQLEN